MKYCYIINPAAGQKRSADEQISAIERIFGRNKLDFEIVVTERARHAASIAARLADENDKVRICASGGDGTLNEVVSGVVGRDNVEVGCYPSGSGNDFIKCFGGRGNFLDFEYIVGADSVDTDVMRVNDRYCLNIFSMGIDASVAGDIPKYRRLPLVGGAMAYNLSLAVNFFKKLGNRIVMAVNGESRSFDCLLMAVCNGRVYGGGYLAAPEADVDDGVLEIVTVKKMPRLRIASIIPVYKKGKHMAAGEIISGLKDVMAVYRSDRLRISSDKEFVVNLDGELDRMQTVDVSVIPKGIKFLVPAFSKKTAAHI